MSFGVPDYLFNDIYEITPDFFTSKGISFVICDIDNTLVTYDDELPTKPLLQWFEQMKNAGITIAFASNNHPPRVSAFNRYLNYPYICDAAKPLTHKISKLIREQGFKKEHCAMLGDQLLTDTMTASNLKILAVNVCPIKDRTEFFFRFKRKIEKQIIKKYWKTHANSEQLKFNWLKSTGNLKGEK